MADVTGEAERGQGEQRAVPIRQGKPGKANEEEGEAGRRAGQRLSILE